MSYIKKSFLLTTKTAEKLYYEYAADMPIFDYHCHLPEKAILENLRRERMGMTTILIAHRISTIEKMDKIIFIEDGQVLAVGTHEELYGRVPEYQTMVDLQKLDDLESSGYEGTKEVGANV